jgi:ribosome-binding factor A
MKVRQQRLADEIRDLLANCFQGGRMEDPRLGGVVITAVKLSPDYQVATVYFRVFNHIPQEDALKGLEHASGMLRHQLRSLDLRRLPTLRFFFDESIERAERIEGILHKINESSDK